MKEVWQPPSPTACKWKWTWSTIFLNTGRTKSCFHNPIVDFDTETFDFHNVPIKVLDRQQMLDGTWPDGCAYCSKTELAGGISDRISQNKISESIPDNLNTVTEPKIVEVFFNNTCNLKCLYCGPKLSSTWVQEIDRYGPVEFDPRLSYKFEQDRSSYLKTLNKFFEWFEQHKRQLTRLHILGGEPFLLKETDQLLEVLSQDQLTLELQFITNLQIDETKFDNYLDKLIKLIHNNNVGGVKIIASIDGWGPEVDFQRFGLDRQLWLRNFNKLLTIKEIKLDINVAITCLTIPTLSELIKMWNEWNTVREVGLQGTRVFDPSFLAPEVLPTYLIKQSFTEALELISTDTWYKQWSKDRFSNLLPILDKYPEGNAVEMKKLKTYLDEISRRRSVDWTGIFPQINKEFEKL